MTEPNQDDEPILELQDVVASYGLGDVLQGVSMEVPEGSVVSLIGRNGAGKTTTLRSILGQVPEVRGEIVFNGTDVTELSPAETVREGIAYVPEERRVFPGLTVRENLEIARMGGRATGEKRSIDGVIDMFENLAENEHSLGSELSGGEQQMLVIGRALVSGARLLMLDEPTEGLAPFIVDKVCETISELHEDGLTVLLVEQNVTVAQEVAEYHYVLNKGRIVYHGDNAELEDDQQVLDRYLGVSASA